MNENAKVRVVVGLSGGVDSSVAAYLLKKQGYDVVGVFMKNWHDESVLLSSECPWVEDSTDAMMVANKLDIPFIVLDFSEEYRKRIVDYMFAEYEAGRTPNPDVLCNREVKFDLFVKAADKLGADYVATGHYCRKASYKKNGQTIYKLLAGTDPNKDQSYFLCQLSQKQLSRALFPIGDLLKPEVRRIAREQDLVTAEKKDSQGLCFIGKVHLPVFLQQQLKPKQGDTILIYPQQSVYNNLSLQKDDSSVNSMIQPVGSNALRNEISSSSMPAMGVSLAASDDATLDKICSAIRYTPELGIKVGTHNGAHYYTVGQRKGLNVGGMEKPLFVIATDTKNNVVYTGMGDDHPGLHRQGLFVESKDVHWVREDHRLNVGECERYLARIRYRQPLTLATLIMREKGLYIVFDEKQKSIAAGQFVAWYSDDECIGSGVID
jgi:tRNA-uridine 2-sulfurtransferase